MLNFCTLFDSNYLTRGLVMYESLRQHCHDFHLYIFPFDSTSYNILESLKLENVTLIPLSEFENEELLRVKSTRTNAEYCWTATSSTILYVLEKFKAPDCTYIDADLFFYSNPKVLIDEMGNNSILITEHHYSPEYVKSLIFGKYCVQFITFRSDVNGLTALRWWRKACIEWCYNREEDRKFGDQKYLDDWTQRFEGVHDLQHFGGGVAPWNVQQYEFQSSNEKFIGKEKSSGKVFDLVFYHFHYVRTYNNGTVDLGNFILSDDVIKLFYRPYLRLLEEKKQSFVSLYSEIKLSGQTELPSDFRSQLINVKRRLKGNYNVYSLNSLLQ